MKLLTTINHRPGELELTRDNNLYRFRYRSEGTDPLDREVSLVEVEPGIFSVLLSGRSFEVRIVPGADGYYVDLAGRRSVVQVRDPRSLARRAGAGGGEGRQTVSAPMPGKVVRVLVNEGDEVEANAGLVVIEAMKMQNELKSPKAGRVVQLKAEVGATVKAGEILVVLE